MNPTVKAYLDAKAKRASVARQNAIYRMRGNAHKVLPLPELPPKPTKYILEDAGGVYVGTEYDRGFALDYAAQNACTVRAMPFDKTA